MAHTTRLLLVLALLAAAMPASAQDATGPLAAVLARGANPAGPFAKRGPAAGEAVVQRAREQLGRRYRFASSSPDRGFDCSGLVKYVLESVGVDLPHNAARIAHMGERVDADSAAMRRMIHASTSQRRVVETRVPARGSLLSLRSVRRVLRDSTTARPGTE
jgi:cell wall-associated NlpC family hydrolase